MSALVISDIHSNLPALDAVLAAAPSYDVVWNLGDVVGYGANPNEVVELARKLGGIVVRGNHDRACCGNLRFGEYWDFNENARASIDWTQKILSNENTKWLSQMPRGPVRPLGRKVACVHGSPRDEDEYIVSRWSASAALRTSRARIVLCGHAHYQGGWLKNRGKLTLLRPQYQSRSDAEEYKLQLFDKYRYILNPGLSASPGKGIGEPHLQSMTTHKRSWHGTECPTRCLRHKGGSGAPACPSFSPIVYEREGRQLRERRQRLE